MVKCYRTFVFNFGFLCTRQSVKYFQITSISNRKLRANFCMTTESMFIFKQLRQKKKVRKKRIGMRNVSDKLAHCHPCGAGAVSRIGVAMLSCVFPQSWLFFPSVAITCLSLPMGSTHDAVFATCEGDTHGVALMDLMAKAGRQAMEEWTSRSLQNVEGYE